MNPHPLASLLLIPWGMLMLAPLLALVRPGGPRTCPR